MIRVLVVDDSPSILRGLTALFSLEPDLEVCGYAASGEDGVSLAEELDPDVVVMDVSLPGMDGVAATRAITTSGSTSRVLVLSWTSSEECRRDAVRAGAWGYVLKSEAADCLVESVRRVARPGGSSPQGHPGTPVA